jgi:hypothetical protein
VKKANDLTWLGGAVALAAVVFLTACSSGPDTGPGEVRWDKVSCERCIMSVSDRHFSAQIRGGPPERKTRLYFFDDLGCAVLWLQEQSWRDEPRNEIWVTDAKTGQWLDARTAHYDTGFVTPMDFGLGAGPADSKGVLNFEQAVQEVRDREARHH